MASFPTRDSPDAPIADSILHDELIGGFFRRGIVTWSDLSAYSLTEIASWGRRFRWYLSDLKIELESRGLQLQQVDAFGLIPDMTRKSLEAAGISSLKALCGKSAAEVRALPRIGSTSFHEIEECLSLANLILRPESSGTEPLPMQLQLVQEDWNGGVPIKHTAKKLAISPSRVTQLRRKLERVLRQRSLAGADYMRWCSQVVS